MLNMKKILIAGAVLTAFCSSAFAATPEDQAQPTMKERVNAILQENDADRPCPPPTCRAPEAARGMEKHDTRPARKGCRKNA